MKKLPIIIVLLIIIFSPFLQVEAEELDKINLEDIKVYINSRYFGTLEEIDNHMYEFSAEEKNFYLNFSVTDEDVEVVSKTGLIELKEGKMEIPITLEKDNQKYNYKMYSTKGKTGNVVNDSKLLSSKEIRVIASIVLLIIFLGYEFYLLKNKKYKRMLISIIVVLLLIVLFSYFTIVQISGNSMNNTLHDREIYLGVNQNNYKRKDIVTVSITDPITGLDKTIIKRIIGMPNDIIEIKNNKLYINGKLQKEDYIKEEMDTFDIKYTLKEDEYFLLGDNRNNSYDSRCIGPVKKNQIDYKILLKS